MVGRTIGLAGALSLALGAAACTQDDEDRTTMADQPAAEQPAGAALDQLPEEMINRLREEYPVLREEPAPEPQPSDDADPTSIPARYADRLPDPVLETVTGEATFYADQFEGRRTASGIPFRQNQMVAAHRGFPFGTILRVTNLGNDRSVNVRVVDRGPFGSAAARGGILDLSRRAATELDYIGAGRANVRVEVLEWGKGVRGS